MYPISLVTLQSSPTPSVVIWQLCFFLKFFNKKFTSQAILASSLENRVKFFKPFFRYDDLATETKSLYSTLDMAT